MDGLLVTHALKTDWVIKWLDIVGLENVKAWLYKCEEGVETFLRDIKAIPNVTFESDHRFLVADFKNIKVIKRIGRTV
jgi:hypothetical protein